MILENSVKVHELNRVMTQFLKYVRKGKVGVLLGHCIHILTVDVQYLFYLSLDSPEVR